MTQKIVFYYGPKSGFRRHLPKRLPITTISELAIYSDRKMREHTFKIQSARAARRIRRRRPSGCRCRA